VARVYFQKLHSVQNIAARIVSGVHRSEHITLVLEYLHWLPVSQRVVFKTALIVWKCVHGVAPAYLSDLCVPPLLPSQVVSIYDLQRLVLYWFHAPGLQLEFLSQRSSYMELSATSTTVTGPVRERLQAGTEDAPVLDFRAPLRRLHDSGAEYKYQTSCNGQPCSAQTEVSEDKLWPLQPMQSCSSQAYSEQKPV